MDISPAICMGLIHSLLYSIPGHCSLSFSDVVFYTLPLSLFWPPWLFSHSKYAPITRPLLVLQECFPADSQGVTPSLFRSLPKYHLSTIKHIITLCAVPPQAFYWSIIYMHVHVYLCVCIQKLPESQVYT